MSISGTTVGTIVESGGLQEMEGLMFEGGVTSGTILDGGEQDVGAGTAIGTTINSGGLQTVTLSLWASAPKGFATGTIINNGGVQQVAGDVTDTTTAAASRRSTATYSASAALLDL
jgi:autotransporter passenger strand-loop-strand repeat protein